jgi:hypothetical protein
MTEDGRDWVDQLVQANVLVATDQIDANGNVVYRMGEFPAGEEGQRLRAIFDRNVQRHDGQHRE